MKGDIGRMPMLGKIDLGIEAVEREGHGQAFPGLDMPP
jgi:hypothetical protein